MPYQGRQPGVGVRNRFVYTATAAQTTFSGADNNGRTLAYQDGAYVDVYLNGVMLVATTDFTATTKTSISLTSGAAASDIVEILAYDISSIADTVSALNGGSFGGAVVFSDGITVSGATGENTLSIPDNLASAFDITEAANSYLKFVTTDSSEAIVAGKTLQTVLVEPSTDDTSDLGASSKRFQDLYLSGVISNGSVSVPTATVVNGSAKAWVNFNGTGTIAARDSFNVASLTDNGTGNYTVNFSGAMANADFMGNGTISESGTTSSNSARGVSFPSRLATSIRGVGTTGSGAAIDWEFFEVSCHGDLA